MMRRRLSLVHLAVILVLLFAAFFIANNNSFIEIIKQKANFTLPDMAFLYSNEYFYDYLNQLEASGREAYLQFYYFIDFIFPVVYSVLGYLVFTFFLQRIKPGFLHKLAFIAFLSGLLDIIENVLNIILIKNFPDTLNFISKLSSLLTTLKIISGVIFIILLFYTVAIFVLSKINKYRNNIDL